ncbi:MAG: hypothetical protein NTV34_03150 [Proteobacteria bacterium]|nr:hypothetical protein [Pseudomonadota bacterium]
MRIMVGVLLMLSPLAVHAAESCNQTMEKAVKKIVAFTTTQPVKVVKHVPGAWTEAVGDNTGSSDIYVKIEGGATIGYRVHAKQIGTTDSCRLVSVVSLGESEEASGNKYSCSNVGGTDEWTIYVDLDKRVAGFFDNDATVKVPFKTMKVLESAPPQTLYVFEGLDRSGNEDDKIGISFNKTTRSASVTFELGQPNQRTLSAKNGCELDADIDLD